MKTLLLILAIIFLNSCTSPEKKIKQSFNFFREGKRKESKVINVQIYDTIYAKAVYNDMDSLTNKIQKLEDSLKKMDLYRDSILCLNLDTILRDSLIRIGFEKKRKYNREFNVVSFEQGLTYALYSNIKDTIAGYYAEIITPMDTLNIVVGSSFNFIFPVPSFEKPHHNRRNIK